MKEYIPYTYFIKWSAQNIWYYGVEYGFYSKTANPNNLWVTYFTSSKLVKEVIEKYGNPDIIQIRKVFNTGDTEHRKNAALSWEDRVLRRMNVLKRNDCINDNITGSKFGKRGKRHTEETKQKISKSHKGKIKTQEHLFNISKAKLGIPNMKLRGRIRSDAHRENLRIANIGKVRSEESKRKTSQTLKITNQNPDVKRKRSIAAKNQKWTKEAIENRNKKLRGVPKSEEHKEKLRTPKNRCSCYYCKKEVSVNNLNRHLAVCSLALITFLQ